MTSSVVQHSCFLAKTVRHSLQLDSSTLKIHPAFSPTSMHSVQSTTMPLLLLLILLTSLIHQSWCFQIPRLKTHDKDLQLGLNQPWHFCSLSFSLHHFNSLHSPLPISGKIFHASPPPPPRSFFFFKKLQWSCHHNFVHLNCLFSIDEFRMVLGGNLSQRHVFLQPNSWKAIFYTAGH